MTGEHSKTQIVAWIAAGAVLVILAWKLLAPSASSGGGAPVSISRPAGADGPAPAGDVYVHVAGAVRHPGLLRAGERVAAAIERAGGARRGADLSAVNLAMRIQDGQQILVPRVGAAPPAGAGGAAAASGGAGGPGGSAKLSLATATADQLEQLDGIGPTLAKRIVQYRQQHGGFRSVDELKQVEGIGDKRFEALKDSIGP